MDNNKQMLVEILSILNRIGPRLGTTGDGHVDHFTDSMKDYHIPYAAFLVDSRYQVRINHGVALS